MQCTFSHELVLYRMPSDAQPAFWYGSFARISLRSGLVLLLNNPALLHSWCALRCSLQFLSYVRSAAAKGTTLVVQMEATPIISCKYRLIAYTGWRGMSSLGKTDCRFPALSSKIICLSVTPHAKDKFRYLRCENHHACKLIRSLIETNYCSSGL